MLIQKLHLKLFCLSVVVLLSSASYCISQITNGYQECTVYVDASTGKATYKLGVLDKVNGTAYGFYNNTLNSTGWGILEIFAGCKGCSNHQIMYAAGFLEGILTSEQIWYQFSNAKSFFFKEGDKKLENAYRNFFNKQDGWMRDMIKKYGVTDQYWRHVSYIISQFDGLVDSYRQTAQKDWESDSFVLQVLSGMGDMADLQYVINPQSRPDFSKMTLHEFRRFVASNGHCSALIKVLPGFEDLFMAHSTWFLYAATMRIFKHYHLNVVDDYTASHSMSFSSYPGFLVSIDDFYVMDSQLVMLQTTNNIFNHSLYDLVGPDSLFAWQRVRVANMMAFTGYSWYKYVKMYNSGTYNNQYMVIDLKRVKLSSTIMDDALWVIEQIPGLVVGQDLTSILRTGYFPSYNVPFFEIIYNMSGYPQMVKQFGSTNEYQLAPRAKIFRRDVGAVNDLESMKAIMRYNDYLNDAYSQQDPWNTICSRGDLASSPTAIGCYDSKVTNYKMALKMTSIAINGPTTSHGLKPFTWTGQFAKTSHVGLPPSYNFDWITTTPKF